MDLDRRTKRTLLVLALLLGISFGLAFEPDSGTQAGVGPADIHGLVLGANHAKPLPAAPVVWHILSVVGIGIALALVAKAMVEAPGWRAVLVPPDDGRHRSVFRSAARAQRGPPAPI